MPSLTKPPFQSGRPVDEPNWTFLRMGMASVAHTFIMPMQDVLGLGCEARMNRPGSDGGNWDWRLPDWALDTDHPALHRLAHLTWLVRRRPDQQQPLDIDDVATDPDTVA